MFFGVFFFSFDCSRFIECLSDKTRGLSSNVTIKLEWRCRVSLKMLVV